MSPLALFRSLAVIALLVICAFSVPGYADSEGVSSCSGCNGYTFKANLVSTGTGTYELTYTIQNVNGGAANPRDWSLTLFAPGNDITNIPSFTMSDNNQGSYAPNAGKANNGSDCSGNQQYALCVALKDGATASTLNQGQSLIFTIDFACPGCTEQTSWDFLSAGNCVGSNGNCYAISQNGSTAVPEPSILTLLSSSVALPLGFLAFRRKAGRNIVSRRQSAAV